MSSESSYSGYLQTGSTSVPGISEIRLYLDTWDHILMGHPEVATVGKQGVLEAVQFPSQVYASKTEPEREYIFASSNVSYMDHPLHVPVKLVEGMSGRIATAYFRSSPYQGNLLWERNDDT